MTLYIYDYRRLLLKIKLNTLPKKFIALLGKRPLIMAINLDILVTSCHKNISTAIIVHIRRKLNRFAIACLSNAT